MRPRTYADKLYHPQPDKWSRRGHEEIPSDTPPSHPMIKSLPLCVTTVISDIGPVPLLKTGTLSRFPEGNALLGKSAWPFGCIF